MLMITADDGTTGTKDEWLDANADDSWVCGQILRLKSGAEVTLGGGAAPMLRLRAWTACGHEGAVDCMQEAVTFVGDHHAGRAMCAKHAKRARTQMRETPMRNVRKNPTNFGVTFSSQDVMDQIKSLGRNARRTASETKELRDLEALYEACAPYNESFRFGDMNFIRADYWVQYCKELVADIGPRDLPSYLKIDWKATSEILAQDYSTVKVFGKLYYFENR